MTKQPDEWLDDVPDNHEEDEEEIIWVSKSEIKRDAEELKRLGAELVDLGKTRWIKSRWMSVYVTRLNWHSALRKKAAAVSYSSSVSCCAV